MPVTPGSMLTIGEPVVIGHRGASGVRPEHTLASYELAIEQGAAFIEPDAVMTRDGVLVARHEPEISGTTDVARHAEFADRHTTRYLDGVAVTGWFTDDFTLAELRTLRAVERFRAIRPANAAWDGRFGIPTLQEVIDLARRSRRADGGPVGVCPEIKHPSYFAGRGLAVEEPLVHTLGANGLHRRDAPAFLQCFETAVLQRLAGMVEVPLVQLVDGHGRPHDLAATGDLRTYADLVTPAGLDAIAGYAAGISVSKNVLIRRDAADHLGPPSPVIAEAHRRGLVVHAWTFRRENRFLPAPLRSGPDPHGVGDLAGEIAAFLQAGVDGVVTDNPDLGTAALAASRGSRRG